MNYGLGAQKYVSCFPEIACEIINCILKRDPRANSTVRLESLATTSLKVDRNAISVDISEMAEEKYFTEITCTGELIEDVGRSCNFSLYLRVAGATQDNGNPGMSFRMSRIHGDLAVIITDLQGNSMDMLFEAEFMDCYGSDYTKKVGKGKGYLFLETDDVDYNY